MKLLDMLRRMKAADNVHVEWVDEEAVVLDPETGKLHYLNTSAALVFALIQEHGYDIGMAEIKQRFGEDPQVQNDLSGLLEELKGRGLIVDD